MNFLRLGAALAVVIAIIGVYAFGRHDGKSIEIASQAAASSASSSAASSVRADMQADIDRLSNEAAIHEQERQGAVREIYHEKETITQANPLVYSAVCVDPDGVRLLNRAADIANGRTPGDRSAPAGDAIPASAATGRP